MGVTCATRVVAAVRWTMPTLITSAGGLEDSVKVDVSNRTHMLNPSFDCAGDSFTAWVLGVLSDSSCSTLNSTKCYTCVKLIHPRVSCWHYAWMPKVWYTLNLHVSSSKLACWLPTRPKSVSPRHIHSKLGLVVGSISVMCVGRLIKWTLKIM